MVFTKKGSPLFAVTVKNYTVQVFPRQFTGFPDQVAVRAVLLGNGQGAGIEAEDPLPHLMPRYMGMAGKQHVPRLQPGQLLR